MSGEGEFGYIARRLAPLAKDAPGALGLLDDAAILSVPGGCELVITADTMVEGRHFLSGTDPALVARKALRVNLSDLAAMGADAFGYLSCVTWPLNSPEGLKEGFADGLAVDQREFAVSLLGGDITASDGPWTISVTALGHVPRGGAVLRSGAKPGDTLMVTGTIGDAGLGLKCALGELDLPSDDREHALQRLHLPEPRLALAAALREFASACADISDGLISDAGHIARASRLGFELDLAAMPLSPAASRWLAGQGDEAAARVFLATAGDDYELAVAVRPGTEEAFAAACAAAGVPAAIIGGFVEGGEARTIFQGEVLDIAAPGFTHF